MRAAQRIQQTHERIQKLLATGDYIKPDGTPNKSKLAEALNMTRKTVANYV